MSENIYLKRKIYDKLLEWKTKSNGKSALLIEGARRVGKSTIVENFAKNEYRSYILIDFNNVSKDIKDLFVNERNDLDYIFQQLKIDSKKELYERESVIIFDEVQKCPEARSLIKYLVADGRYDYLETGSLISIKENIENIVIPSEEDSINMYPLDFEEFCWALGDNITIPYIKEHYESKTPLGQSHSKIMKTFRIYTLVGGMPQAVTEYIKTKDFGSVDEAKKRVLKIYEEDMRKSKQPLKTLAMYNIIPSELSKHSKILSIGEVEKGARNREYEEILEWLKESKTVNVCYNTTDPSAALALTLDKNNYKIYNSDTGLLTTQAYKNKSYLDNKLYNAILFNELSINEGMVMENFVAQTLKTKGYDLYFYRCDDRNNRDNNMEIDFIIIQNEKINPIEVKSGQYKKHTSIDRFKKKFKNKVGIRYVLHTKDLKIDGDIVYLPLYMTMFL